MRSWGELLSPQSQSPGRVTRDIPAATLARLPLYHRVLGQLRDDDVTTVSSAELAELTGVNSAKVRKDLSHLGSYGTRGVGYDVAYLDYQISRGLGITTDATVLIVGAGNLGRALASYAGFASRGFRVLGLLDIEPTGQQVGPVEVGPLSDLERIAETTDIGVVAVPAAAAQEVCDRLVAAGITSILNFAPAVLTVPADVEVREVDLGLELQILAFHAQQRPAKGAAVDLRREVPA
ncbi:MAG: redox-sensing transcriptional repressor Rex [Candidatus Nanopelagicales bacterium]